MHYDMNRNANETSNVPSKKKEFSIMSYKNRIFGLILAGALSVSVVLGIAGCSNGNENSDDSDRLDDQLSELGDRLDNLYDDLGSMGDKLDDVIDMVDQIGQTVGNEDGQAPEDEDNGFYQLPMHDQETLLVDGTGVNGVEPVYRPHNFDENGQCKMCDETTIFSQQNIATEYKDKISDEKGTVTEVHYTGVATADAETGEVIERDAVAYVYTPYGYDAEDTETKYEVLYMLHGNKLNEGFWFAKGSYNPNKTNYNGYYCTENVLDDLMKTGAANKTICVAFSFDGNAGDDYVAPDDITLGKKYDSAAIGKNSAPCEDPKLELTRYLMPYVAENYNTYAEIPETATAQQTDEILIANRAHQGFVGLSLGSVFSYEVILKECLAYFGYVGSFSGGGGATIEDNQDTIDAIKAAEAAGYPLYYWYNSLGTMEESSDFPNNPLLGYIHIKDACGMQSGSDIANGDNCEFVWCEYNGHSYMTWVTSLYNCMQVFFKAPQEVATYSYETERGEDLNKYAYDLTIYENNTYRMTLVADWYPNAFFNTAREIISYGTYTSAEGENGIVNYTLAAPTRIVFNSYGTNLSLKYSVDTEKTYSDNAWLEPEEFNPYGYFIYQQSQRSAPEIWTSPAEFIAAYGRTYSIVANTTNGTMTLTVTSHDGVQINGYDGIDKNGKPIVLEQ